MSNTDKAAGLNISPEAFAYAMAELKEAWGRDPEAFHCKADALMHRILVWHGYGAGVEIFRDTETWCA